MGIRKRYGVEWWAIAAVAMAAVTIVPAVCQAEPAPPPGAPALKPGTLTSKLPALKAELVSKAPYKRGREGSGTAYVYTVKLEKPYFYKPVTVRPEVYVPDHAEAAKLALEVTTPPYGSKIRWKDRRYVPGAIQLAIPIYSDPMLQGMIEGGRAVSGRIVHNYQQRLIFGLIDWIRQAHPVDPERVILYGQYALWGARHGDVFSVVMADPYGNYAEMIEAQKRAWQWGTGQLGNTNWLGIRQWVYMHHSKWIAENPGTELPYVITFPGLGTHVGDMGFLSIPATFRALADTKRAFSGTWGGSWGLGPPATLPLAGRIRRHQALPAFRNCSIDDCPGDGRHGADGDANGQMNGFLMWEPETIRDEPKEFGITIYLHKNAPAASCTADATFRRCRKFKARAGEAFKWSGTDADGKKVLQAGTAEADKCGLVTLERLKVSKARIRVSIVGE